MRAVAVFFACVLFCMVHKAALADDKTCNPTDFMVTQTITGLTIGGKQEFEVNLINNLYCAQSNVKVSCDGLHTTEPIDPHIIRPLSDGTNNCLVNNGAPISHATLVAFKYAWDVPPSFSIISSDINCS
uniref:LGC1 n=1 Tax=Lilium longiflorum TaxID=4690 RepID=Q9ZPJ7_LILLO|nr:LGC1 [Lilium longiflorum]